MQLAPNVVVDDQELEAFCRRYGIRRLALFGSALSGDLTRDSDIDLLVEFEPDQLPGLLKIAALERELGYLFDGRDVDLRTAADLSPRFRDRIRAEARELYAAA